MTTLTNLAPASSYGDLLTTTNSGQGLSVTLQPIQDGFGNNSILTIATNAFNINTSAGTFLINSVALTATATQINTVCSSNTFPGTAGFIPPSGTTAQRPGSPANGEMRFNTTTNHLEAWNGASWTNLT